MSDFIAIVALMYIAPAILCLIASRMVYRDASHHESQIQFFTFKPLVNIPVSIWALLVILDRLERRKRN